MSLSTNNPMSPADIRDGMYYELTYNGDKEE